mmetsp:Transcript_37804/g.111894  ORF Transcript_37804/g.111894 Transcript_37804/m.111894 type:complete len:283 (-) Transcript_37804:498-1346(-)
MGRSDGVGGWRSSPASATQRIQHVRPTAEDMWEQHQAVTAATSSTAAAVEAMAASTVAAPMDFTRWRRASACAAPRRSLTLVPRCSCVVVANCSSAAAATTQRAAVAAAAAGKCPRAALGCAISATHASSTRCSKRSTASQSSRAGCCRLPGSCRARSRPLTPSWRRRCGRVAAARSAQRRWCARWARSTGGGEMAVSRTRKSSSTACWRRCRPTPTECVGSPSTTSCRARAARSSRRRRRWHTQRLGTTPRSTTCSAVSCRARSLARRAAAKATVSRRSLT